MILGPVFSFEMVTSARRARYYVVRAVYAGLLLLALGLVHHETMRWAGQDSIAAVANFTAAFFMTFAWMQLLAVTLLGPAMAAGTIAVERERRTIEYLFVSDLRDTEIVFGKLAARLAHIIALVLAGWPVLALAMLLGGIAPEALGVLLVLTVSTVLFVAVLSITVSVWSPTTRDAVMRAYLVLICLIGVPWTLWTVGLWNLTYYTTYLAPWNDQLLLCNPFYVLISVLEQASTDRTWMAWTTLAAMGRNHLIVALAGAAISARAVRRVGRRREGKRLAVGLLARRPPVGEHPMFWKELFAEPTVGRLGWPGRIALLLIVLAVLGPTVWMFWRVIATTVVNPWPDPIEEYLQYAVIVGAGVSIGLLLIVAARAATLITSEKERDCWTSLINTPLEAGEILRAKLLGNLWAMRWLMGVLAVIWGLGVAMEAAFCLAVLFMSGTLLLLAIFLSALGLFCSLRCRTSLRAMGVTLAIALVLGGGYLFLCIPMMNGPETEIILAPCMPFLVAMPGVLYVELRDGGQFHEEDVIAAYILGILGYSIGAAVLIGASVSGFDQFCGRGVQSVSGPLYRPPPTHPPV